MVPPRGPSLRTPPFGAPRPPLVPRSTTPMAVPPGAPAVSVPPMTAPSVAIPPREPEPRPEPARAEPAAAEPEAMSAAMPGATPGAMPAAMPGAMPAAAQPETLEALQALQAPHGLPPLQGLPAPTMPTMPGLPAAPTLPGLPELGEGTPPDEAEPRGAEPAGAAAEARRRSAAPTAPPPLGDSFERMIGSSPDIATLSAGGVEVSTEVANIVVDKPLEAHLETPTVLDARARGARRRRRREARRDDGARARGGERRTGAPRCWPTSWASSTSGGSPTRPARSRPTAGRWRSIRRCAPTCGRSAACSTAARCGPTWSS